MKMSNVFLESLEESKQSTAFRTEELLINYTRQVCTIMNELDLTRSDLAKMLNKKRPFITRILKRNHNVTIKTMVSVATALKSRIELTLIPEQSLFHKWISERQSIASQAENWNSTQLHLWANPASEISDQNKKTIKEPLNGEPNNDTSALAA